MSTTKEFDRYVLRIYGRNEGTVAHLMCFMGPNISGGYKSLAGIITFKPDGSVMPQDRLCYYNPNVVYITLYMPWSRFDAVMSTLRAEKPLHLYINANIEAGETTTPGYGHLATSEQEPIGEEEEIH